MLPKFFLVWKKYIVWLKLLVSVVRAICVKQRMQDGKGLNQIDVAVFILIELFARNRMGRAITLHGREINFVTENVYTTAYLCPCPPTTTSRECPYRTISPPSKFTTTRPEALPSAYKGMYVCSPSHCNELVRTMGTG